MLGYPKMAAFQKTKLKKNIYITGAGKQNSIKCLSNCYCGMSMGVFSVVREVVMNGGEAVNEAHVR